MLKTFIQSFKLCNTYKVNTIIYSIKQIPIIKKILPNSLYKSKALKIIGNIISILMEIASIFLGKLLYIALMIFAVLSLYKTNTQDTFLNIITFLTIAGALLNTYMFNPTKDKYYAMFIMKMDAKKYALSNYWYAIAKIIIGFMPFTIIFGLLANINLAICILIPFYVAWTIAYSTFMIKGFVENIPKELDEAIYMDGGSVFTVFRHAILPLAKPGIASVSIFNFLTAWEEFPWANTVINDDLKRTLPIAISGFFGQHQFTQWGYVFALSVFSLIPILLVFIFCQKFFVAGLASGSVKG